MMPIRNREELNMTQREQDQFNVMLSALYSILNIEGAAEIGAQEQVYKDLDCAWHFNKVRRAINLVDPEGTFQG